MAASNGGGDQRGGGGSSHINDLHPGQPPHNNNNRKRKQGRLSLFQPQQRMVIYNGPSKECDLIGDPKALSMHLKNVNSTASAVVYITSRAMKKLIDRCDMNHARLFSRDPAAYFDKSTSTSASITSSQNKRPLSGGGGGGGTTPTLRWDRSDNVNMASSSSSSVTSNEVVQGKAASSGHSLWSLNMFNRILIFPGTKWCGQGSVAEEYNDIGYHASADRCCRDHDLCLTLTGEYMSPGICKYGICNFSPVTRSPCQCDKQFVRCLKKAKTKVANALGKVFFNVAGLTCYKFEYPIKRCVEYVEISLPASLPFWIVRSLSIHPEPQRPRCRRYELDLTKPKMWQFFETVYDDVANSVVDNARSEEPRSYDYHLRHRRPNSLGLFQKIVLDVFMSFIDPY